MDKPGDSLIREHYQMGNMATLVDLLNKATKQDWNRKRVSDRANRLGINRLAPRKTLPAPGGELYVIPLIEEDSICLAGDIHAPFYDRGMVGRLMELCEHRDIRALALVGDIFDAWIFSSFDRESKETTWEKEKETVTGILGQLLSVFDKIYILPGNHDWRILRALKFQENFQDIIGKLGVGKNIITFKYPIARLIGGALLIHPNSYSRVPGAIPRQFIEKHGCNVFIGHTHLQSITMDKSARYLGVEIGCLCDTNRIDYRNIHLTTHPEWNIGFAIYEHGNVQLFNNMTNWDQWLNTIK